MPTPPRAACRSPTCRSPGAPGGPMATKPKTGPAGVSTIQAAARTYRLAPTRARAAPRSLPKDQRESHGWALLALLHLLEEHCPEGAAPIGFLVGRGAYRMPALHWAAAQLRWWPLLECDAPDCTEPQHVTLLITPISAAGWRAAP